jgi:diguanylate cyclase (GGDEF)-like protein
MIFNILSIFGFTHYIPYHVSGIVNKQQTKVLVADDDQSMINLLKTNLKQWGFDVLSATNGNKALSILQGKQSPSLAVLDSKMQGLDSTQLYSSLRNNQNGKYTYVISLVGDDQYEEYNNETEYNADDYLTKPCNLHELKLRLNTAIRTLTYQEKMLSERESLRKLVTYDSLTKIYNRAAILGICEKELVRSNRQNNTTCLIMVDVDDFKRVNDTYGHIAGDNVLREIAKLINDSLRPYDSVGRYGGEEFLIVVPNCECTDALELANRIRLNVEQHPVIYNELTVPVTISLGVATMNANVDSDAGKLIDLADHALLRAKAKGKNRVERLLMSS